MLTTEEVRSPILTYQHPDHENRVDLVGTVHVAEPAYYQAVQEFVDDRANAGATVHYELVETPTPEQLAEAPRRIRRKAERSIAVWKGLYGIMGDVDGLIHQTKGIVYREEWQNHDSTLLEQCATMSHLTIGGLWASVQVVKLATRIVGQEEMQTVLLQLLRDASSGEEHKPGLAERLTTIGREKHTIAERNAVAFAAFDTELRADPTADILLLWGVSHLKGLGQGMRNRGFVQTDERYLTAIHARNFGE